MTATATSPKWSGILGVPLHTMVSCGCEDGAFALGAEEAIGED
jgi:hypothetical protein